jgi:hypothetical protein
LLAEDDTRVGLIWRADRDGIAWQELVERGELTTNGLSNTRTLIRVLTWSRRLGRSARRTTGRQATAKRTLGCRGSSQCRFGGFHIGPFSI